MTTLHSQLPTYNLKNQRVLVRADLNVPLENGIILDDYRLQSIRPTLDLILQHQGKIILMTHIGRPKQPTKQLSTQNLVSWFEKHGYDIEFAPTLEDASRKVAAKTASIILLENLRFFPGEKVQDVHFAQQIAALGDFYVNDAFATMHRSDSSITLVPNYFEIDKKTIGLLVEKEIAMLNKLLAAPKKGFVLIIGGGKVADKLPLLANLLDKVETILLCPALVFTFLKALGKPVGKSLVDDTSLQLCNQLLEKAQQKGTKLVFPVDYQMATDLITGPLEIVESDQFPPNGIGMSLGPQSIEIFSQYIQNAQTIFYNAAMGFFSRPQTIQAAETLLTTIAKNKGLTIIGGGESVALAQKMALEHKVTYLSTGGGATLTYLSGKELPGLLALTHTTNV